MEMTSHVSTLNWSHTVDVYPNNGQGKAGIYIISNENYFFQN